MFTFVSNKRIIKPESQNKLNSICLLSIEELVLARALVLIILLENHYILMDGNWHAKPYLYMLLLGFWF